ncbi:MAG: FlgD immunoglobulin-like domain containing protein [bacterium]
MKSIIILMALIISLCFVNANAVISFSTTGPAESMISMYYEYFPPAFKAAAVGESLYFDRDYLITSITPGLAGKAIVLTLCDEKIVPVDSVWWSFTISEPADVYIGFHVGEGTYATGWDLISSQNVTWVSDWTKVEGEKLDWERPSDPSRADYADGWYKKNGTQFNLQGQGDPEGGPVNYVVLIDGDLGASSIVPSFNLTNGKAGSFTPYPNPAWNRTVFSLQTGSTNIAAANIKMNIYDVKGNLVYNQIQPGVQTNGSLNVQWDGKDNNGTHLSQGVYMALVKIGNKTFSTNVILSR